MSHKIRNLNSSLWKLTFSFFFCFFIAHPFYANPLPVVSDSSSIFDYSWLPDLPDSLGYAGAISGISGEEGQYMIIAGGANFEKPFWESTKKYSDKVFILQRNEQGEYSWNQDFYLDQPMAYGAVCGYDNRIFCAGGNDSTRVFDAVYSLFYSEKKHRLIKQSLPSLSTALTNGSMVYHDGFLYVSGGCSGFSLMTVMNGFYRIKITDIPAYHQMDESEMLQLTKEKAKILGWDFEKYQDTITNPEYCLKYLDQLFMEKGSKPSGYKEWYKNAGLNSKTPNAEDELMRFFWGAAWEELPALPGAGRAFHLSFVQHNGSETGIYILSGRRMKHGDYEFLTDLHVFNPALYDQQKLQGEIDEQLLWQRKTDIPACVMAGEGIAMGSSHFFVFGGADGSLVERAEELKEDHPGFPLIVYGYHTITDSWISMEHLPQNNVTSNAFWWDESIIIPGGEIKPRIRSPRILKIDVRERTRKFGTLNYTALLLYLLAMLGIGVYFTRKNKNTNDYFRGGQKIPWWAAGCSIFATMLSSITYMSVPAKAYMTNWEYLLGYPAIFIVSGLVVFLVLPFFRRIDATTAYEYLEKRFNRNARLLGSGFFVLFQIGRMGIVMFLSAIALSVITPFSAIECILIMAVLSILYSSLGGLKAVIWTDTIQTFVLLGGAFLILGLVFFKIDGGVAAFFKMATAENKFRMINWDWDLMSFTRTAFWVIIIGSIGQNLISYTSDQSVVQRYMTTSDEKQAAKAIWTNGIMSIPAGILFFTVGTALYVFYKTHPWQLDPGFQNDAVMPLFIVNELPAGIAGLLVAGIFAAAQSTVSTSMNSTATAVLTDFISPYVRFSSDRKELRLAKGLTVLAGVFGTFLAILFARADIKSLFDEFIAILGLFGGALGGLFLLGMFSRRANAAGAVPGVFIGALCLYLVKMYTHTHLYLYAIVGITSTVIAGYLISRFFPSHQKNIEGLTIYDLKSGKTKKNNS